MYLWCSGVHINIFAFVFLWIRLLLLFMFLRMLSCCLFVMSCGSFSKMIVSYESFYLSVVVNFINYDEGITSISFCYYKLVLVYFLFNIFKVFHSGCGTLGFPGFCLFTSFQVLLATTFLL
jgi:hypothetical protein